MDNKLQVYHFHNGTGGGVLSVIRNLLKFSKHPGIENHVIYTINKDLKPVYTVEPLESAQTEQVFYYSPKWNFYYTCRQLAKLLPDGNALIVAHDWLELGMVSQLGLQNPVVSFLHGDFDYYYDLAKLHQKAINKFICISPVILKKLTAILDKRGNDIFYKRFPVPEIPFCSKNNNTLHCIYFVRDLREERKQFSMILEINRRLILNNVNVFWTIAGGGLTTMEFNNVWSQHKNWNVEFKGPLSNEDIVKQLAFNDVFILPSLMEGFPVAVVEAMKAGVVPVITNWEGATEELVIDNTTGYYCKAKDVDGFVEKIKLLSFDRQLLRQVSINAAEIAERLFDPFNNTREIENIFKEAIENNDFRKTSVRTYGSKLDQPWLGNIITSTFRNTFKKK